MAGPNVIPPEREAAGVRLLKTYAGRYVRCEHCGIYDSDPSWCDLCGRPKQAGRRKGRKNHPADDLRPGRLVAP